VDGVGKGLLLLGDAFEGLEALVTTVEEGDFGTVSGGSVRGSDNVVVGTEEAVHPSLLLLAAEVKEIVNGAVEAGIAVLSTAAEGLAGVVGRVVSLDKILIRNVSAISIKGVDL
jgi:hypothetical protein